MTAVYNKIGAGYDRQRRADPGIAETLARGLRAPRAGPYLDLACGSGKHDPGFYLDKRARAAISTFAKHGDSVETRQGLARLEADITAGRFAQVRQMYQSDQTDLGDYLFVSARRL
ncbi:MAG: hypothetical protein ISR50_00465 [Alphaproteobacteria bacterium]|nr:hypothetical protein [Alphaproteobacteria bacterium]MBL6951075.1 hypothetical protein [Alphaproteobacteria bacterium]